ncbi:hypothetical protein FSP39_009976, partial [Pinctada imbricata]
DSKDSKLSDSNTTTGAPFRGMGKEELLQHSGKPFWRRLRMICISIVLIGWLALIITVVALVLIYPRCKTPEGRDWWQRDVIYRVYVRSFKDSNNDGIGDLKGLTSKLDYIKDLGVGAISLSAIYTDDGTDGDFHIMDHKSIDSNVGTIADFRNLLSDAHAKGLKVILDYIPNHTSDNHQWFIESRDAIMRNDTHRNYYVWTDYPTNWRSVDDSTAWNRSSPRDQYYLHQFRSDLPDLNLRSSQVQQELEGILKHWLNEGVDGFYVRDSGFLFEDYDMRDESLTSSNLPQDEYNSYNHEYTYGLPEVMDMLSRWRHVMNNYTNRVLLADINGDVSKMMELYGYFKQDGVDLSLNRMFRDNNYPCDGACVRQYVNQWMTNLPTSRWANWVVDDDSSARIASRFNESFVKAFYMVTMLLPGTPFIYYGDEIGMKDVPAQTPDAGSMLSYIKNLTKLRQQDSFVIGEYHSFTVDNQIVSFVREFDGKKGYLVAVNFGTSSATRDFTAGHSTIEKTATVEFSTGSAAGFEMEADVDTSELSLPPNQGVVVSWDYVAKEL